MQDDEQREPGQEEPPPPVVRLPITESLVEGIIAGRPTREGCLYGPAQRDPDTGLIRITADWTFWGIMLDEMYWGKRDQLHMLRAALMEVLGAHDTTLVPPATKEP